MIANAFRVTPLCKMASKSAKRRHCEGGKIPSTQEEKKTMATSALHFKYLTPSNLEEASSLAAAAFAKTPCYVQMLPGNEDERGGAGEQVCRRTVCCGSTGSGGPVERATPHLFAFAVHIFSFIYI